MFCTQCGTHLADTARYCTSCGQTTTPGSARPSETFGPPPKKLHRIIAEKKVAGVCAGFADYFDTDITLMRVIWVAIALLPPNVGIIAYIVAWAVMPKG